MESANFQRLEDELIGILDSLHKTPPYLLAKIADKATVIIKSMDAEIPNAPADQKAAMQAKVRRYRHEVEAARPRTEAGGLGRAIRIAVESENIGEETSGTLRGQREQLIRARDRLVETDAELSKVSRLITSIRLRVITNKLFLIVIIILEVAILLSLCYLKFFVHK